MNKSIAALTGALILGAIGLQALAQSGQPKNNVLQTSNSAPATSSMTLPPVRTAVLNINKVLKNFNKAQQLNNMISAKVNFYGQQIQAKRDEVAKIQADLAKTADPNLQDQLKKRGVQLEREMQDLDVEARKQISAQQGQIAIDIFQNIHGVIQRVAAANGFDLVLSYPDATTDTESLTQPNVVRKLAAQAAIPIYYKPHIDITDAVIQTLNATYHVSPPPATTSNVPATSGITPIGGTAVSPPPATSGYPKRN